MEIQNGQKGRPDNQVRKIAINETMVITAAVPIVPILMKALYVPSCAG